MTSGFQPSSAPFTQAAYVSGSYAPTSAILSLEKGSTYYIRVVAYSSLGQSEASPEITVAVSP
jgi:hypothetical protein